MATVKIEDLVVDSRFQNREDSRDKPGCVNQERVERYKELMEAGVEFPPLRAAKVGKGKGNTYVIRGFHTAAAHQALGKTRVPCEVEVMTLDEALAQAACENQHGAERQRGDVRNAIHSLLQLEAWKDATNVAIAKFLGASEKYVRFVRDAWNEQNQDVSADQEAGASSSQDDDAPKRNGPTKRRVKRGGTVYEMDVSGQKTRGRKARASSQAQETRDNAGQVVPAFLLDLWGTTIYNDWVWGLSSMETEMQRLGADLPFMDVDTFLQAVRTAQDAVNQGVPHAVCPYCHGEKCEHCKHCGLVPKFLYDEWAEHNILESTKPKEE